MHDLGSQFELAILQSTGASSLRVAEVIQSLWSGYGQILRVELEGSPHQSVVVKHVRVPGAASHPRGWHSDVSHQRKVKSYEVETAWHRDWGSRCDEACRIPEFLASDTRGDEVLMVLEDLDAAGYPARRGSLDWLQIEICLAWLANFHATFLGDKPDGLWPVGTYWHLDTRTEELQVLDDQPLREAARAIDTKLSAARFQGLVHGDAKIANFCFSEDGERVAAVDFQYVGGGCGMKDVAYFVGSCLDERSCEKLENDLLDYYFSALRKALGSKQPTTDADAVVAEWRGLYHLAWTDFHRFLKGWSPGHWKLNCYSERVTQEVLASL